MTEFPISVDEGLTFRQMMESYENNNGARQQTTETPVPPPRQQPPRPSEANSGVYHFTFTHICSIVKVL